MERSYIILVSPTQRAYAVNMIAEADVKATVTISPPNRTHEQNAKMWAILGDISKQCRLFGQKKTPEAWKVILMRALGIEIAFEVGLDGEPFPIGLSTSKLGVKRMADLITFISAYGDEQGVEWKDTKRQGWLE